MAAAPRSVSDCSGEIGLGGGSGGLSVIGFLHRGDGDKLDAKKPRRIGGAFVTGA
jgi:hypothetical protein